MLVNSDKSATQKLHDLRGEVGRGSGRVGRSAVAKQVKAAELSIPLPSRLTDDQIAKQWISPLARYPSRDTASTKI